MAVDSLRLTAGLSFGFRVKKAVVGSGPREQGYTYSLSIAFGTGAGAGACNELYAAVRTLAASTTEDIDLSAALTNVLGEAAVTLARIKAILVWLLSTSQSVGTEAVSGGSARVTGTACSSITLFGAASNPWQGPLVGATAKLTVDNGNGFQQTRNTAAGWVVDGTHDTLRVTNDDGAVAAKYVLALAGAAT